LGGVAFAQDASPFDDRGTRYHQLEYVKTYEEALLAAAANALADGLTED